MIPTALSPRRAPPALPLPHQRSQPSPSAGCQHSEGSPSSLPAGGHMLEQPSQPSALLCQSLRRVSFSSRNPWGKEQRKTSSSQEGELFARQRSPFPVLPERGVSASVSSRCCQEQPAELPAEGTLLLPRASLLWGPRPAPALLGAAQAPAPPRQHPPTGSGAQKHQHSKG